MPILRQDNATNEYGFTTQESIAARTLDPLKLMWLQTKYAQLWKMRNSISAPEDPGLDRSYFLKVAELDGKMNIIQELLDDHKAAQAELVANNAAAVTGTNQTTEVQVAQRGADLVHIQTG